MDFDAVIRGRRSIRSFQAAEVEEEKVKAILDAVRYIPSAHNFQDFEVFVVKSDKVKKSLVYSALGQDFLEQAPVIFVVCADTKKEGTGRAYLYSVEAASLVAYIICLKAFELGLGSCWIGAFNADDLKDVLQLSTNLLPIAIIPVGYSSENPTMPKRRDNYCHFVE